MQKQITINKTMHNRKIEYILKGDFGFSENIIKKLKKTDAVTVNGKIVCLNHVVSEGDCVVITMPHSESKNIVPEEIDLDILYEDDDILAVNKEGNMLTHPSKEHYTQTLANGVVHYLKNTTFHVITRLDKETSGVVLIAKNQLAAHKLNAMMKKSEIKKEYIALINGTLECEEGVINAPIGRGEGIRRIVTADGKMAETHYKVEKVYDNISLVRLNPITGRTHQLRVHMQYMGTPILGDWLYGAWQAGERVKLHCRKIEFIHPVTHENIIIVASEPSDMREVD